MMERIPPEPLTVVCVLRTGAYHGRCYTAEWVTRLQAMVAKNLSRPHRFVCLTDLDEIDGVEVIKLRYALPGWWSKLEMFGLDVQGKCVYLDLDVLITGSLDEIAAYDAPMAFTPPHHVLVGKPLRNRAGVIERYQTSCISWSPKHGRDILFRFGPSMLNRYRSDQDWIAALYPYWPLMPKDWFCKLRTCYDGPPPGVKVVLMMPEKNDVAAQKYPWVKELWFGDLLGAQGGVAHT